MAISKAPTTYMSIKQTERANCPDPGSSARAAALVAVGSDGDWFGEVVVEVARFFLGEGLPGDHCVGLC
jgi:hypothetical protein